MGILGSILGGVMQATHGIAKAMDEVAEHTGAPPLVRAATSSIAEMTARGVAAFEEGQGGDAAGVSTSNATGTGLFSGVMGALTGGSSKKETVAIESPKLGGNALKQEELKARGTVNSPEVGQFYADHNNIEVPNVGTAQVRTGVGVGIMNA